MVNDVSSSGLLPNTFSKLGIFLCIGKVNIDNAWRYDELFPIKLANETWSSFNDQIEKLTQDAALGSL